MLQRCFKTLRLISTMGFGRSWQECRNFELIGNSTPNKTPRTVNHKAPLLDRGSQMQLSSPFASYVDRTSVELREPPWGWFSFSRGERGRFSPGQCEGRDSGSNISWTDVPKKQDFLLVRTADAGVPSTSSESRTGERLIRSDPTHLSCKEKTDKAWK